MKRWSAGLTMGAGLVLVLVTGGAHAAALVPGGVGAVDDGAGMPGKVHLSSPLEGGKKAALISHGFFGGVPYALVDAAAVAAYRAEAAAIGAGGYASDLEYRTMEEAIISFDGHSTYVTDRGGCIYIQSVVKGLQAGDIVEVDNNSLYNGTSFWDQAPYWVLIGPYSHNAAQTINNWLIYVEDAGDGTYTMVIGSGVYNLALNDDDLTTVIGDWFGLTREVKVWTGAALVNPLTSSRGYAYSTTGISGGALDASSSLATPNLEIVAASPVYVDDDWAAYSNGDDAGGHVYGQDAFDGIAQGIAGALAAGTVDVAAGAYREQLYIDKSLALQGAGAGLSVIEAVDTGARTTRAITNFDGTARTIDPCVMALAAGTVTIDGFTVDGRDLGPNYFYGIYFHDTSGAVSNCEIVNVRYAAVPNAGGVASLVANHSPGTTASVAITGNSFPNIQKGAIVVMGPGITCAVDGNDIVATPSGSLAANGIQISYGSTGTASGNTITGTVYTGSSWSATGLLLFEPGDVTIAGGEVHHCQTGVGYSQWNWLYTPPVTPSIALSGVNAHDNDWCVNFHLGDAGVALDLTVADCLIVNNAYSGLEIWGSTVDPWGGSYYGGWADGSCVADIHGNTITGNDYGFDTYRDAGVPPTNALSVTARDNDFSGNASYGVYSNFDDQTLDCESNWWGSVEGPTLVAGKGGSAVTAPVARPFDPSGGELPAATMPADPGDPAGKATGVNVSPYVDFEPWLGMADLAFTPATSGPISCAQTVTLDFVYTPDAATPELRGYNVVVATGGTGITFDAADFANAYPFGAAPDQFFVLPGAPGEFTVSGAQLGGTTGLDHQAVLFRLTVHPAFPGGTGTVDLSGWTLRDLDNGPIVVDTATGAVITVDCVPPGAPGAVTALPGHEEVGVSWTDSPATDVVAYEIWRAVWYDTTPGVSAYPEYDDLPNDVIPARPASRADVAAGGVWALAGTFTVGVDTKPFVDAIQPRGVYWYEVFALDAAGNYSAPTGLNDGSTNYWLGDVEPYVDGYVGVADITELGATFGTADGDADYDNWVDVGPTDDNSRRGIPLTDSVIDFEDLMIFAMNYGFTMPKGGPATPVATVPLVLARVDDITWSLALDEPCPFLKGLRVTAALPPGASFVEPGALLAAQAAPHFLRNLDRRGLDASLALLGTDAGFAGSGELLRFTLPAGADPAAVRVTARGLGNEEIAVALRDGLAPSPAVWALAQNAPNPFNPKTTIAFSIASSQRVRLAVYAVDGTLVRGLLDAELGAGGHEAVWDGRDEEGRAVASGTYFCRIEAGPWSQTRKMVLMK